MIEIRAVGSRQSIGLISQIFRCLVNGWRMCFEGRPGRRPQSAPIDPHMRLGVEVQ
jgi:hypothetical protein